MYDIAQRLVGADRGQTVAVAEQILDLNLGSVMVDGQRFTNAAYIEPGWVLELPAGVTPAVADSGPVSEPAPMHVVERGETLWSIARDEMGAATRWPEIWELNRGADMGDGSVLVEPDLIMPGWQLDLPSSLVCRRARGRSADRRHAGGSADDPCIRGFTGAGFDNVGHPAIRCRAHRGHDHRRPGRTSRPAADVRRAARA